MTTTKPRFEKTSCSSCGEEFGPGDSGFSHCKDHEPPAWDDDKLQFARLLWELDAAGLTQETLNQVSESMDLDSVEVQEIFARAIKFFETAKETASLAVLES